VGLVSHVSEPRDIAETTANLAVAIAGRSGVALSIGKRTFARQLMEGDLSKAYEVATEAMVRNALADDAREGIGAFLDKRHPNWTHG